jgi:hypothetical protein
MRHLMVFVFVSWLPVLTLAQEQAVIGEVVFAVGPSQALNVPKNSKPGSASASISRALTRGQSIFLGEHVLTGPGAHVHIRFVDGAFVAVRPESRLVVEQYEFNPSEPSASIVKFQLMQGVARSITGKAGEAAKERFRLNTPVAAIGVRGTDFVVATRVDESRAIVNRGAIVVAPIGFGCSADSFGPCSGLVAKELTPAMGDLMARVQHGQIELVSSRGLAPERIQPGTPEPKAPLTQQGTQLTQAQTQTPSSMGPNAAGSTAPVSSAQTLGAPSDAPKSGLVTVGGGGNGQLSQTTAPVIVQAQPSLTLFPSSSPDHAQQDKVVALIAVRTESQAQQLVTDATDETKAIPKSGLESIKVDSSETASGGAVLSDTSKAATVPLPTSPSATPGSKSGPSADSLSAGVGQAPAATGAKPLDGLAAPGADKSTDASSKIVESGLSSQALTYVNPTASTMRPATLHWGRWASEPLPGDTSEKAQSLIAKGANSMLQGSSWTLYGLGTNFAPRPREGVADFILRDAIAYYQSLPGSPSQAQVLSGSLGMDFVSGTFSSRLNTRHSDLGAVMVMIHGTIGLDGKLESSPDSPSSATGVLANQATEAAYRFSQRVTDAKGRSGSLFGLTRWGR